MSNNDTRTAQERAEELASHKNPVLDHMSMSVRANQRQDQRNFVKGFLARDAEPTTITAESLEGEFEDIDYEAVDRVAAKHGLTRHQAFAGAQALHSYEESKRGISGQIVRGVEARHVEAAIKVIASVKNLGGPS